MLDRKGTHWSTRLVAAFLAFVMLLGNVPVNVFATEITGEEIQETTVPETSAPAADETEPETTETIPETTAPAESGDLEEQVETVSEEESAYVPLYREITVRAGQLVGDTCEIVENEIYGYVVDYKLKKGHTLSISDTNYVFSVRVLQDGNYSTMLKQTTSDSYTATEDMTVGMLIRKPDKSALTAEELAARSGRGGKTHD